VGVGWDLGEEGVGGWVFFFFFSILVVYELVC